MRTMRKPGRKMSDDERRAKPFIKLVHLIAQFIRRDFGGMDQKQCVQSKFAAYAARHGKEVTSEGVAFVADFALEFSEEQINGVRTRVSPSLDEISRRIEVLASISPASPLPEIVKKLNEMIHGKPPVPPII